MASGTDFLERLLDAAAPSGFEYRAARVWRDEAEKIADEVSVDLTGNSLAVLNPGGRPRVMLAGHIDEIGLQVTHIDDEGFLFVDEIGGWDPLVLVGNRVRILGQRGDVVGVVGKKPIHLMKEEERQKAPKVRDLWLDLGASGRDAVLDLGVRVGDPVVVEAGMIRLAGDRIASRAIDDRIGAFVVLEALRLLREDVPDAEIVAVATVQEEIGYTGGGAKTSAYGLEPGVAIVVDVTFSTDVPEMEKKELGDHKIGGGPVLSRGSAVHPAVFERLAAVARESGIGHTIQAAPRATRTDADGIHLVRRGIPTGLVSVPNRYMHSPNEIVSLEDLGNASRLLAAFVRSLDTETDFTPR
jgi:endoglucanase